MLVEILEMEIESILSLLENIEPHPWRIFSDNLNCAVVGELEAVHAVKYQVKDPNLSELF